MSTQTLVTVLINAKLQWQYFRSKNGNYIGVCDPLKITLQADTFSDLTEEINITLNALMKDLLSEGELDRFLRDRGWTAVGLPTGPMNVRFDVPFSIEAMKANGQQAVVHQ